MTEENKNNNTPQLDTQEDLAVKRLRPYLLDPREEYPEPFSMLEYNGVPFSTVGGLAAISGQKKNGKSFVLTMLMAAILQGDENTRVPEYLPGLRVPDRTIEYLGHLPKVLYVDTEMERLNSAKVLRRVHWLCGWDMKMPNERFNVLWLKTMPKDNDMPAYKSRFQLIQLAIEKMKPDVVFIDGLRDMLASINDEETTVQMLDYLASTAEEHRMCIWNALHQNPRIGSDGEDKMRGWAGTELGNKVSDTLISIKKKEPTGVTFTVKQVDARGKDMDDWKFIITEDAGKLGIPKIIGSGVNLPVREKVKTDTIEEIRTWIVDARDKLEWPMSRKDIKEKVFKDIGKQKNKDRQEADLQVALNYNFLVESAVKTNGYFMLDIGEEIDKWPF
jgi:hypothetical protein